MCVLCVSVLLSAVHVLGKPKTKTTLSYPVNWAFLFCKLFFFHPHSSSILKFSF